MARTYVVVEKRDGVKIVVLQNIGRDTFPWTLTTVRIALASRGAAVHTRSCDYEDEALRYFDIMSAKLYYSDTDVIDYWKFKAQDYALLLAANMSKPIFHDIRKLQRKERRIFSAQMRNAWKRYLHFKGKVYEV